MLSKLKYMSVPVFMTIFYLLLAILLHLVIDDGLIVTIIADIVVTILCLIIITKFGKPFARLNVKQKGVFVLSLIGCLFIVWLTCQLSSTMLYSVVGDSNFDKYTETAISNIGLYILLSVGIAPIMEEVLMRGLWFGWIRQHVNPILAYILSAFVFAVLHGTLVHMPTGILFGLFLCVVYDFTGSLLVPILLHFGFNIFAVIFGGIAVPSVMTSVPFASVLYVIVFCAIIFSIIYKYKTEASIEDC